MASLSSPCEHVRFHASRPFPTLSYSFIFQTIVTIYPSSNHTTSLTLLFLSPTYDTNSADLCSWHSVCICYILLDEWPTSSRTKSSSRAQKVPCDWKPSLNAQHTRMGDVCEMGTRIQSVMDRDSNPPLNIHLILFADSDIIHINALGTSMIILNSYKVATDLLDQRSSIYSNR